MSKSILKKDIHIYVETNLNDILLGQIKSFIEIYHKSQFTYSPEFLAFWNLYLLNGWKPLFLKVCKDENLIGIFPLMYRLEKRRDLFPYRRIRFFASTHTDFSVIFGADSNLTDIIYTSLNWLFRGDFKWELMILEDLVEDNPAVNIIEKWLLENSIDYKIEKGKYYYINLMNNWENIKNNMSKKFVHRNLNLAQNRLNKSGDWKILYNPAFSTEDIIKKVTSLHIKRQHILHRTSLFEDRNAKEFFLKVVKNINEKQELRTYWLMFENEIIAYMLGFYFNNSFYWWNTAFDPKYSWFSPSRILLFYVIEDMHKHNYREFNFMRGESSYKEKWTKSYRANFRFRIKNNKYWYAKMLHGLENLIR